MKLINGGTVPDNEVTFDRNTYHFMYQGVDITDSISRNEKLRVVPGFDIERDNYRLSDEGPVTGDTGNFGLEDLDDSTASNFAGQIITDPFSAPLDSLNNLAEKFMALDGIKKVLIVAAIGAVLYIAVKKA